VAGRALVFSDPQVVRLLRTQFVPYAGDQWYLHRQQDAAGEFFWKVVQQGHRKAAPRNETRQGVYVSTPEGELLGSDHFHPWVSRMMTLLNGSLERWRGKGRTVFTVADAPADERFRREPPPDGLILRSYTRIPLPAATESRWDHNQAVGRDFMWLTRAERLSLRPSEWRKGLRYPVPEPVAERLVRFHLTDNVRGEPPMWEREAVKQSDLHLVVEEPATGRLRLEGTARLEAAGRYARGYDARLQGVLQLDRESGQVKRADLLSWGEAWGHGPYTGDPPPGRFPLLIAFSLAGNSGAERVPPQGSRDWRGYFGRQ
jgi:hypothetical protein